MAVFMEVLDTSIANIALPHIAGQFVGDDRSEATWVLTSYLVSNAIILPMTGWLGNYFGRKRVLISCIVMFTVASALCGLAWSLPALIIARILQGVGRRARWCRSRRRSCWKVFRRRNAAQAMAAFAHGRGGGADSGSDGRRLDHGQLFLALDFLHQPAGRHPGAALMAKWLVEDPPYIKRNQSRRTIDFIGFGLLAVWLATLQIILDKGQEADWFSAHWICWFTATSVASFVGFIAWEFFVGTSAGGFAGFQKSEFHRGRDLDDLAGGPSFTAPRRNCRCSCKR